MAASPLRSISVAALRARFQAAKVQAGEHMDATYDAAERLRDGDNRALSAISVFGLGAPVVTVPYGFIKGLVNPGSTRYVGISTKHTQLLDYLEQTAPA